MINALDNQEREPNTFCVGAPIYDAHHRVIGACSVSAADPEIVGARTPTLTGALMHISEKQEQLLASI